MKKRAPFWWFGGKGHGSWILPHIPKSHIYVEPFCGAANIFWNLEPRPIAVLNDLDGRIVNFFRVLQDRERFDALAHRLRWTPYARAEFVKALSSRSSDDPVEAAWGLFVAQNQGFGGKAQAPGDWGRNVRNTNRGMALVCSAWQSRLALLEQWRDRVTRDQIECRDALEVIRHWDTPDTFFYCDPPYVHSSRKSSNDYACEMTDDQHTAFIDTVLSAKGMFGVSGYDNDIYKRLDAAGWRRVEKLTSSYAAARTRASGLQGRGMVTQKQQRTEVLWLSPNMPAGELRF